ncbi:protein phosphatase 2C domain-containing protein [Besnoitia besnoiti]|uniref:Protein phosphatase 2C domain-containing protein n=1 Tax=Besnoitia besnoiti TaxID=94643 RepID=A0A2A9MLK9_BESBE|nr:protein phosphatase 2C domain-containing protein [Besnoitia besnoiti]PFH37221.1 protein phosphatase 2C domain-containing protein [Besnoitia besnoiti]
MSRRPGLLSFDPEDDEEESSSPASSAKKRYTPTTAGVTKSVSPFSSPLSSSPFSSSSSSSPAREKRERERQRRHDERKKRGSRSRSGSGARSVSEKKRERVKDPSAGEPQSGDCASHESRERRRQKGRQDARRGEAKSAHERERRHSDSGETRSSRLEREREHDREERGRSDSEDAARRRAADGGGGSDGATPAASQRKSASGFKKMGELTRAKFLVEQQQEQEEKRLQHKKELQSEHILERVLGRARASSRAQRREPSTMSLHERASFASFSAEAAPTSPRYDRDLSRRSSSSSPPLSPASSFSALDQDDESSSLFSCSSLSSAGSFGDGVFTSFASTSLFSAGAGGERKSKPKTESSAERGFALSFGVSATVGRRQKMEDTTRVVPCFLDGGAAYFAMFDGHNGSDLALFAALHMHSLLEETLEASSSPCSVASLTKATIQRSLVDVFHHLDRSYERQNPRAADGATALVMVVRWLEDRRCLNQRRRKGEARGDGAHSARGDSAEEEKRRKKVEIHVAHAGDTRAVLGSILSGRRSGLRGDAEEEAAAVRKTKVKAERLTHDHKPNREDERRRIDRHGGTVIDLGCPRVMVGSVDMALAVSRCLGDFALKRCSEHIVLATPDVSSREIESGRDSFIVIASDGLWDVLTDEEAAKLIQRRIDAFFNEKPKQHETSESQRVADARVAARETCKAQTEQQVAPPAERRDGWYDEGEEANSEEKESGTWWSRSRCRSDAGRREDASAEAAPEKAEQDIEAEDAEAFEDYVPKAVLEKAANDLIKVALARMSQDNISVLILHFAWTRKKTA